MSSEASIISSEWSVPGVDSLNINLSVPCNGKLPIRFVASVTTSVPVTEDLSMPS